ncbi:acyltransferase, partial [Escherichia coli]|nr:acyltransferase [Escherichia coli]
MSSKFRNDINGLRALAVAAVIIYHFNSSYMSSGFAGVDVFFVISGYLMTSIIVNKFNDGNFKLFDFYLS